MKNIFSSKTVWFNSIMLVIGILTLPEFLHVLPAWLIPYDVLGTAIGNLILRVYFTSQPIGTPQA